MYNKLEEQEYASMVQKYRSEYGGRNLRGFCLEHKVSYQKMLHCLRRESYRNTQQAHGEAADNRLLRKKLRGARAPSSGSRTSGQSASDRDTEMETGKKKRVMRVHAGLPAR